MMRVRRSAALRALLPAPGAGREEDRCFLISSCHLGFPIPYSGTPASRTSVVHGGAARAWGNPRHSSYCNPIRDLSTGSQPTLPEKSQVPYSDNPASRSFVVHGGAAHACASIP